MIMLTLRPKVKNRIGTEIVTINIRAKTTTGKEIDKKKINALSACIKDVVTSNVTILLISVFLLFHSILLVE